MKDDDKNDACFDLQKVLHCPRAESSAFYYKRHLAIYNFTIYDCTRNERSCYLWNETIGKKGSNEIASFLFHFIGKKVDKGIRKFVLAIDLLKLKDLLILCNSGVIPQTRHAFYQSLLAANKDVPAGNSNKDE